MNRVITVTLNPALDITANVERVVAGKKLRCQEPRFDPGGGGVNISRALAKFGELSIPFVASGGAIGDALKALLCDEEIEAIWFDIPGISRQSIVIDEQSSGAQYRFVLPGPSWPPDLWQESLELIAALVQPGDLVVGSGSLPPGVPDDYYVSLCRMAKNRQARALIDTSGRALDAISRSSDCPAAVVLMDDDEASQLLGEVASDEAAMHALARRLVSFGGVETVILTLSEKGAMAVTEDGGWRAVPPVVPVASKVGAGDSFMAGIVLGMRRGWPLNEIVSFAVAAAASAVTTPATELCTKAGTEELRHAVMCTALLFKFDDSADA